MLQIEVCEKAEQFPGWLHQFLLRYDICPGFISPLKREKGEPCLYACDQLALLEPNLLPERHLYNSTGASNKTDDQRMRRQTNTISGTQQPASLAALATDANHSAPKRARSEQTGKSVGTRIMCMLITAWLDYTSMESGSMQDLDKPLSTRRPRRTIVATKRHEIVIDNPVIWRRRQETAPPLADSTIDDQGNGR